MTINQLNYKHLNAPQLPLLSKITTLLKSNSLLLQHLHVAAKYACRNTQ